MRPALARSREKKKQETSTTFCGLVGLRGLDVGVVPTEEHEDGVSGRTRSDGNTVAVEEQVFRWCAS